MAGRKEFPLSVVIAAVDKLSGPMRKIAGSVRGIGSAARSSSARMRELGAILSSRMGLPAFAVAIQHANKRFGVFRENMAAVLRTGTMVSVAVAGLSASLFGLVNSFSAAGDQAAKTAQRLGVGVEWLQEMRFAAERSGIAQATLDMALQRVGRRIGEFIALGKGEAAPVLEGMGFTREQLRRLGSVEKILPLIADKLSKIQDPMVRNAIAMKLFDSEGVAMVQMLGEGAEGMEKLRAEARRLGLVIGEDAARDSEQFQDTLTNLKSSLLGVRNIIGAAVIPEFIKLGEQLTALIVEHRPQIQAFAARFAEKLPERLEAIWRALVAVGAVLGPVLSALGWLAEHTAVLNALLIGLAAVMGTKVILALYALAGAVKVVGAAMLMTPVGWLIMGLAAVAAAGFLLVKNWDKIAAHFTAKFDKIRNAFKRGLIDGLIELIKQFNPITLMAEAINGLVKYLTGIDLGEMIMNHLPDWARRFLDGGDGAANRPTADQMGRQAAASGEQRVRVEVDFANMPKGVNVGAEADKGVDFDVSQGYVLAAP